VCDLIKRKLGGKLDSNAVLHEDTMLEDLGLASLEAVDVVYSIEDRLQIELDCAKAAEVKTIGELVSLVNETVAQQAPGAR
jgi:acyl carrier protein